MLVQATVEDTISLGTPIVGSNQSSVHVHPGQIIAIPVRDGLNRDPLIWGDDADEYRPERWFEPGTGEKQFSWGGMLTFGDGYVAFSYIRR